MRHIWVSFLTPNFRLQHAPCAYALFPNPEGTLYGIPYGHCFGLADVVNIGMGIAVGLVGNEWRCASLVDCGFEKVGVENARTPDSTKAAYLRRDSSVDGLSRVRNFLRKSLNVLF